jgi:hypothetical protein
MPNGQTVHEHTRERVELVYAGNKMPLLPSPG